VLGFAWPKAAENCSPRNGELLPNRRAVGKWLTCFTNAIKAGRIPEGHGDLRPEHICLKPDLAISDCLEFSRDLRIVDTADDLAFLALECERLGVIDLADLLLRSYNEISGD
jgi:aminoglycoside phosphotransferase family enzyme